MPMAHFPLTRRRLQRPGHVLPEFAEAVAAAALARRRRIIAPRSAASVGLSRHRDRFRLPTREGTPPRGGACRQIPGGVFLPPLLGKQHQDRRTLGCVRFVSKQTKEVGDIRAVDEHIQALTILLTRTNHGNRPSVRGLLTDTLSMLRSRAPAQGSPADRGAQQGDKNAALAAPRSTYRRELRGIVRGVDDPIGDRAGGRTCSALPPSDISPPAVLQIQGWRTWPAYGLSRRLCQLQTQRPHRLCQQWRRYPGPQPRPPPMHAPTGPM
jgi:hypothetical protein